MPADFFNNPKPDPVQAAKELVAAQERIAEKQLEAAKVRKQQQVTFSPVSYENILLEANTGMEDATNNQPYLFPSFFPAGKVIGLYGRGSSSKSSFMATVAAEISHNCYYKHEEGRPENKRAGTLWVSSEEDLDWIKTRHTKCGGKGGSLHVFKATVTKTDKDGVALETSFNVYEHLEASILQSNFMRANQNIADSAFTLRLVILDTAVALTSWTASAGPNSDEGVKRLMAYLRGLASKYDVTIVTIGHVNKGKHEHFADSVMGSAAWTTGPRMSFMCAVDKREEFNYVIRTVKSNLYTFAASFSTEPVHTLKLAEFGAPDAVLVKTVLTTPIFGEEGAAKLWKEATEGIVTPEQAQRNHTKESGATRIRDKVVELLQISGDQPVTRAQVEAAMPDQTLTRKQWLRADKLITEMAYPLRVNINTGHKNTTLYYRQAGIGD